MVTVAANHIRRLVRRRIFSLSALFGFFLVGSRMMPTIRSISSYELPSFQDIAAREPFSIGNASEEEPEMTAELQITNKTGTNGSEPIFALSYSLYGFNPRYAVGIINVVKRIPKTFPGWQAWIYHDDTFPPDVIRVLSLPRWNHIKLINTQKEFPSWVHRELNPMTWRFLIASDPRVDVYAIRDGDSLPSSREKAAVDEWLRSGKAFHIMRDHMMHNPKNFAPILGGMWGGLHKSVPNMDQLLRTHYAKQAKGRKRYAEDQNFLWQNIMPLAYNNCLQHDSYYCRESNAIAFPISREDTSEPLIYVGNAFAQNDAARDDPRLRRKEFIDRYNSCLDDRRKSEKEMKAKGMDFARNVNTTFIGRRTGSSTEAWDSWVKTFN